MADSDQVLGHFKILRSLGKGGMGEVFLAEDTTLDRKVALKFLSKEALLDPVARRRFLREAKSAAALDDPFICKVYEIGEADDEPYIAMEYIKGESLSARLSRGPLSLAETVKTAREIAEALSVAHEHGIIHRDLKPSNIMLTSKGHAKVLDFGLAKQVLSPEDQDTQRKTGTSDDLTAYGETLGTLAYMSPEQLQGKPLSPRSDVFSFGVIVHEMIAGKHPFNRPSSFETASAILSDPTPTLEIEEGRLPGELTRFLAKALDKDPEKRFGSAAEIAEELRTAASSLVQQRKRPSAYALFSAATVAAIVVFAGMWLISKAREPALPAAIEPLLVLVADFDNRTGDEVFSGVLEEATGIGLEGASFINSYRRGDAREVAEVIQPGDAALDEEMARLIAQREGIDVVITGSISEETGRYAIWVEAIEGATGEIIALREVEAESRTSVLEAVGKLAGQLRESLGDTTLESVRVTADETFTAASLEAAHAYVRAQDLVAGGKFEEAIEAYTDALELDPDFGRAYAGLGVVFGNLRREAEAEENYQKAFEHLDRMTERERYRTLGGYFLLVSHNYEKAIENYQTLVELFPADGGAHSNLGYAYLMARRFDEAVDAGHRAVALDPENLIKRINFAIYATSAGDFETTIVESEAIYEQNPDFGYALFTLGRAAAASGNTEEAKNAYTRLAASGGMGSSLAPLGAADLEMYLGQNVAAVAILETAIDAAENPFQKAAMLVALGEARLAQGHENGAIGEARKAIRLSQHQSVLYLAARLFLSAGDGDSAEILAGQLEDRMQSQTTALAGLIRGEQDLLDGDYPSAVRILREAWQEYDIWFAHYLLGRSYFEVGHYPEAQDEFDHCVRRKGEIADVFLVDSATLRYYPPALYWLGRAREELGGIDSARELYAEYLELRGGAEPADALAAVLSENSLLAGGVSGARGTPTAAR